jgi:adenosylmethionine-8-amino-7-oxononanoate aminotransferase
MDKPNEARAPVSRVMVDFQQMKAFSEHPFIVERGEGIYLYDAHGKRYLDGLAGVFVVSVGHGNAAVIESIVDQMHQVTFAPPLAATNTAALRLAERLWRWPSSWRGSITSRLATPKNTRSSARMARITAAPTAR